MTKPKTAKPELVRGRCPACQSPNVALEVDPKSDRLECGACGSISTRYDVERNTGSKLATIR